MDNKQKKTGIICTLGPVSANEEMVEKLINAGMTVARFNFSHQTVAQQQATIEMVKRVRDRLKSDTILMPDTKGPDVRLGHFKNPSELIEAGQTFKFYFGEKHKDFLGTKDAVFVPYEKFPKIINVGAELRLNDGTLIMEVTDIKDDEVTAFVKCGGVLKNNKALAAPGFDLELPFISPEDILDMEMAVAVGADWVAASAVSKAQDVLDLRELLDKLGGKNMKIISKIECRIGMKNLDAIIEASDGMMVARGGLGTDLPMEEIPVCQRIIIDKTRAAGKFVIVATMMMETMTTNASPTRAEISDVVNAVWDGADYVMFSAETASGKYPIETVEFAKRAVINAEKHSEYSRKK